MSSNIRRVNVALADRSYNILIGNNLLGDATQWLPAIDGRHVLIVTNDQVAPLYLQRVQAALGDYQTATVILPDGEAHKTLASVETIFAALAKLRANRDATILALGGGVVGDMAGFAAACWMRGIAFVQMPTTLLAQVDSSVGGKTGVDLPQGKNLIGAFHQPNLVLADLDTLQTLPKREFAAGMAEVIKYGAIRAPEFLRWLDNHHAALQALDGDALGQAIETSCLHKADIVARDERESGERALLNFGHTFAHALETATGYETLRHGEAVAIGMVLAARLSADLGLASNDDADALQALLAKFDLPTAMPQGLNAKQLLELMRLDKKALSGKLRLILWRGAGRAEAFADVEEDAVLKVLSN